MQKLFLVCHECRVANAWNIHMSHYSQNLCRTSTTKQNSRRHHDVTHWNISNCWLGVPALMKGTRNAFLRQCDSCSQSGRNYAFTLWFAFWAEFKQIHKWWFWYQKQFLLVYWSIGTRLALKTTKQNFTESKISIVYMHSISGVTLIYSSNITTTITTELIFCLKGKCKLVQPINIFQCCVLYFI